MRYTVVDENGIDNNEFDFYLEPGYQFHDGDFEPDLVAGWVASGRVVIDAPKPKPGDVKPLKS